jgi:hypothetical protein
MEVVISETVFGALGVLELFEPNRGNGAVGRRVGLVVPLSEPG